MHDIVNQEKSNINKKIERIASAIFLITNLIPQGESIKDKIKDLSLKLVSISVLLDKYEE